MKQHGLAAFLILLLGYITPCSSDAVYMCQTSRNKVWSTSTTIMGSPIKPDTSRQLILKRGSTTLVSASGLVSTVQSQMYVPGETLTLSISSTASTQVFFQASNGAVFSGGVSMAYDSTISRVCGAASKSITMPAAGGQVTLTVAWAFGNSQVSYSSAIITSGATSAPTPAPTPGPTPLPGNPTYIPTASPITSMPQAPTVVTATYTVSYTLQLIGISQADFIANQVSATTLISSATSISTSQVVFMDLSVPTTAAAIPTSSPSTSSTSSPSSTSVSTTSSPTASPTLSSTIAPTCGDNRRRSLEDCDDRRGRKLSSLLQIKLQLIGFTSLAAANSADTLFTAYLADGTSTGFVSSFNSQTQLTLASIGVLSHSVTSASLASATSFQHSCALNSILTMSWNILPAASSTSSSSLYIALSVPYKDVWLSAGLVPSGMLKMVAPSGSPNQCWLYDPSSSKVGLFSMLGYTAGTIVQDYTPRVNTGVQSVQSINGYSAMTLNVSQDTGVASDIPIELGAGATNTLIWAHGGVWPSQHPIGAYGFVLVDWNKGTCLPAKNSGVSPGIIYFIALPIIVLNSDYSPLRDMWGIRFLRVKTVPWQPLSDISFLSLFGLLLFLIINIVVLGTNATDLSWKGIATASGKVALLNFWIAIIPTSKSSFAMALFGVPFERAVKYHKLVVALAMLSGLIHLLANFYANNPVFYSTAEYGSNRVLPLYGFVAFIFFSAMSALAFEPIRKAQYELFMLFHHLHWLGVAFVIIHLIKSPLLIAGFVPGLVLQAWDVARKQYLWLTPTKALVATYHEDIDATELVLEVPKIDSTLGKYFFINIKIAGLFQWHPISIANLQKSYKANPRVTFYIKPNGLDSWSRRLADSAIRGEDIHVSLDGPYGSLLFDLRKYSSITMICGGIGVTPFLNILDSLTVTDSPYLRLNALNFIWVVRKASMSTQIGEKIAKLLYASPNNATGRSIEAVDSEELPVFVGVPGSPKGYAPAPTSVTPQQPNNNSSNNNNNNKKKKSATSLSINVQATIHVTSNTTATSGRGGVNDSDVAVELAPMKAIAESRPTATNDAGVGVGAGANLLSYKQGRPDVAAIIAALAKTSGRVTASSCCVLVCGPPTLSEQVHREAIKSGIDVHVEVFGY